MDDLVQEEYRPYESSGTIRCGKRIPLQYICDLVDPPGNHPRNQRQEPVDPTPRAFMGEE